MMKLMVLAGVVAGLACPAFANLSVISGPDPSSSFDVTYSGGGADFNWLGISVVFPPSPTNDIEVLVVDVLVEQAGSDITSLWSGLQATDLGDAGSLADSIMWTTSFAGDIADGFTLSAIFFNTLTGAGPSKSTAAWDDAASTWTITDFGVVGVATLTSAELSSIGMGTAPVPAPPAVVLAGLGLLMASRIRSRRGRA